MTENSDAIKLDGLIIQIIWSTYSVRHDDFGIYESFIPGISSWGQEHYLLGGELYKEFIEKYGENETCK